MAKEISGVSPSGILFARVRNKAGLWWNGASFEAYAALDYANYAITMTQEGLSGVYTADFPAGITAGGTYEFYVHLQTGGAPAEGDVVVNTGKVDWTGSTSVSAAAGSMSGSTFRDYIVNTRGFKRPDKDNELYEFMYDAIQEMRRRFSFDEAEIEASVTQQITVLGQFKMPVESDMGLLLGIMLEDLDTGTPLVRVNKQKYDELYPYINADPQFSGYPRHFCIFNGQIYIGPRPDRITYNFRLSYSSRAGVIVPSTTGVPFTNLYRDVLSDLVLSKIWDSLEEFDKAAKYRQDFENGFALSVRRERLNGGQVGFIMEPTNF